MPIAFRAASTVSGNSVTSIAPAKPSGTVEGDVIWALLAWDDDGRALVLPSGWTLAEDSGDVGGSAPRLAAAWKAAGGSEPSSYTFGLGSGGGVDMSAVLVAYSGVDPTAPVDVDGHLVDLGADADFDAPSVTTTVENARVVVAGANDRVTTISTPAGTTSRGAVESVSGINASLRVADFDQATPGATGVKSFTAGLVSGSRVGLTVALRPGNEPPDAPTGLSPDGTTVNRSSTRRFSWSFSDPDVGDSQSKYDLRYREVGAGSWTDVTGTTSNAFHDFAGGTFAAGDYEWQVRTYDALGAVGPYTSSAFFTAADPPDGPTITAPTAGQTISAETFEVAWSTPSQTDFQVRTVADDAGSPDTGTVFTDTGEVASVSTRSREVGFDTDGRDEWVQVRTKDGGLWSDWASVDVEVSYTVPATPTVTVAASDVLGHLSVSVSHPAPTGGEPAVTAHDVWRRVTAEGGDGIRVASDVAPSLAWPDWAVASGVDYEYRVRARGDNGTSVYSEWAGAGDVAVLDYYGGGFE